MLHTFIASATFQFHKGSIQTGEMAGKGYVSGEFQFHKGSIQTQMEVAGYDIALCISIP